MAVLKEALVAAEKRSDAAAAAADAAAAVARMRDEKEIDLRSQVAALQRQQADASAAAAAAAAAASKRETVVASLEQRYSVLRHDAARQYTPGVIHYVPRGCFKTLFNFVVVVRRLREALANAAETQRGAQRAAAAAAADKDASERRLHDAEAKIQEMTTELEAKEETIR